MTAEIAILNKSAVALAADSAMTIGDDKIYNTVNKIFEISEQQPIGVMIYGSPSYMGLPMEVLVKQYRRKCSGKPLFKKISECAEDFATYLGNGDLYSPMNEEENVYRIVYCKLKLISQNGQQAVYAIIKGGGECLPSKLNNILGKVVKEEIGRLKKIGVAQCFASDQRMSIDRKYKSLIDECIDDEFTWLKVTKGTLELVRRLVRLTLDKAELSRNRTGIVVAGFGDEEICPTLCSYEIDGIINGKLKRSEVEVVDIDRGGSGADVKAFAQREMVERFLQGVDPAYDEYVQDSLQAAMKGFATKIFQGQGLGGTALQNKVNALAPVIKKMKDDFVIKSGEHKEKEFRRNVLNMVQFMPNQELATLAESLIDLTSLKRRMSAGRETVGGEIDVAIISKSDGFVWIKRKHYFPKELNPRFFYRHYEPSNERTNGKDGP